MTLNQNIIKLPVKYGLLNLKDNKMNANVQFEETKQ